MGFLKPFLPGQLRPPPLATSPGEMLRRSAKETIFHKWVNQSKIIYYYQVFQGGYIGFNTDIQPLKNFNPMLPKCFLNGEDRMRRNHWLLIVAVVAALAALSACGAGTPPAAVPIEEACAPEQDGQRASVIGYFQADFMVFCTESCTLKFAEAPGGESVLSPDVKVGSGKNQMSQLPDDFQEADFQFKSQDGTTLGLNDQVQLSGKMSIGPNVCLMYVDQIRPAP
jgi:hypothetical protein